MLCLAFSMLDDDENAPEIDMVVEESDCNGGTDTGARWGRWWKGKEGDIGAIYGWWDLWIIFMIINNRK